MARGRKAKGLGDTIEQITTATGIKAVVDKISEVTGIDCGCDNRKEALNKLWSYRSTENKTLNCLSEDSIAFLKDFLINPPEQLTIKSQERLKAIYKEVFNLNFQSTSCGSCWRDMIRELQQVYNATVLQDE
jgi:hypothetical protein